MISATSGFRFCGMIEDPDVNSSVNSMKENSALDQITISSAMRERFDMRIAQADKNSTATSRLAVASMEFSDRREKPNCLATYARSRGNDVPASAAEPSG